MNRIEIIGKEKQMDSHTTLIAEIADLRKENERLRIENTKWNCDVIDLRHQLEKARELAKYVVDTRPTNIRMYNLAHQILSEDKDAPRCNRCTCETDLGHKKCTCECHDATCDNIRNQALEEAAIIAEQRQPMGGILTNGELIARRIRALKSTNTKTDWP